ncbi:MATE family efflux transporter [Clostridium rectalis]|uniref:MATE family efflux transporter n=1 Tax=Clostridium rectalis TaxID=2040295 RepID=UPI000F633C26|nr:MATE family efflux transporter [Clostridium rectalis]
MGIDDRIFTNGKIGKTLFKFAVPSVISLLVAELYNLVDTIFVGRYINSKAIGALTIAFPIQRFLIALGLLIAVGTSTMVARSLGEKNYDNLKKGIISAFSLTLIVISIVTFTIFIFKKPIIISLGASENIYPLANSYISIVLMGAVFQCLGVVASYIMTALGNTKITLQGNLIGAIANIIIDYLLVVVFKIGIEGAAIATVISQILSFTFIFYKFSYIRKAFNIKLKFKLSNKLAWTIITVGFSTFIVEISDAVIAAMLNNLLYAEGGDAAVITVGVVTKLSMFMYITIIGISAAMQPIIAYNYGASNFKKMREALRISIITIVTASLGFWAIFMIFAKPMIGFFLTDAAILPEAIKAFRICILLLPAISIEYITIYYYQAIGESKKSFLLSIFRQLVVFIPVAFILIKKIGVMGAWIAYPVADVIAFVTAVYFIRRATEEIEEEVEMFQDQDKSLAKA